MATSASVEKPVLPFARPQEEKPLSESIASDHSLLEIDRELDMLFDKMQEELEETGVASPESIERFHSFCHAYGEKVDRIGRFIRVMEARTAYCKAEAALYRAPYWNVNDRGDVCLGTARVPPQPTVDSLPRWESAFFESEFTHPNASKRLTEHPGGFVGLWRSLAEKRRFPAQFLAAANQTLHQFITS